MNTALATHIGLIGRRTVFQPFASTPVNARGIVPS